MHRDACMAQSKPIRKGSKVAIAALTAEFGRLNAAIMMLTWIWVAKLPVLGKTLALWVKIAEATSIDIQPLDMLLSKLGMSDHSTVPLNGRCRPVIEVSYVVAAPAAVSAAL